MSLGEFSNSKKNHIRTTWDAATCWKTDDPDATGVRDARTQLATAPTGRCCSSCDILGYFLNYSYYCYCCWVISHRLLFITNYRERRTAFVGRLDGWLKSTWNAGRERSADGSAAAVAATASFARLARRCVAHRVMRVSRRTCANGRTDGRTVGRSRRHVGSSGGNRRWLFVRNRLWTSNRCRTKTTRVKIVLVTSFSFG